MVDTEIINEWLKKAGAAKDPSLKILTEECEYLNTFYIETRYPVHWPTKFSYEEALKAYKSAEKIFSFIKEKIKIDK